jgi:hypothetical protein
MLGIDHDRVVCICHLGASHQDCDCAKMAFISWNLQMNAWLTLLAQSEQISTAHRYMQQATGQVHTLAEK